MPQQHRRQILGRHPTTATPPAHAVGTADVVVTNPDAQAGTLTNGYTYIGPPNVTGISPGSGTVNGGTSVTITGTDFQPGATVTVGGVAATSVTFVNSTSLTATTGAHVADVVDVIVTNPDIQTNTLTGAYTYVGSLTITAAPADYGYSATLNGTTLNLTSSFAVGVRDSTGNGAGWNVQATIGTLTSGANTIPPANQSIQSVAISGVTGTGPTNGVGYPLAIPTASGEIYNAAVNTGTGQATMTFNTRLVVPADTFAGTYTTTLTVTIAAGP